MEKISRKIHEIIDEKKSQLSQIFTCTIPSLNYLRAYIFSVRILSNAKCNSICSLSHQLKPYFAKMWRKNSLLLAQNDKMRTIMIAGSDCIIIEISFSSNDLFVISDKHQGSNAREE
ncbi:hypothetical protein TW81_03665 [Vibrio galatheae]|uniref:Uncharacterized protein n=1 Tax=Vibrio galatheae TaxID=579748 RepID=A0A0F4NRB6_9VIBR|nr:hypothetical protein TW81_03665 [Vibrio galatheae]